MMPYMARWSVRYLVIDIQLMASEKWKELLCPLNSWRNGD